MKNRAVKNYKLVNPKMENLTQVKNGQMSSAVVWEKHDLTHAVSF